MCHTVWLFREAAFGAESGEARERIGFAKCSGIEEGPQMVGRKVKER